MTEELRMLHLATIIDNGSKAPADGYAKSVGYTTTVGYSAPIGNMETKSESESALEAAMLANQEKSSGPENPVSEEKRNVILPTTAQQPAQPVTKKSLTDRIKEKPLVYALIVALIAFLGYKFYKSRK